MRRSFGVTRLLFPLSKLLPHGDRRCGLADDLKRDGDTLTPVGFVSRIRELDDPEIVEVVTRSSLACALSA